MGQAQPNQELVYVTCVDCGIWFGFPKHLSDNMRERGKTFYCPSGHSQWWGESTVEKLERKLKKEQTRREWAESEARRAERDATTSRRGRNIALGKLKASKLRSAAGVCPCCHRSFEQIRRHMKDKHPTYKP